MNKIKLFCLPYAGGSAMVYTRWKKYLDNNIELCPIEVTGRGKRIKDPFCTSINEVVNDVFNQIKSQLDQGMYAIFGHSMGSLITFELVSKIQKANYSEPVHVFISGRYPPHIKKNEDNICKLSDEDFKNRILSYGGTPKELFEHRELLDMFLPILKADYEILDKYQYSNEGFGFNCDISVLGGNTDENVSLDELTDWRRYAFKGFRIFEFEGGHFFINEKITDVVKIINENLILHRNLNFKKLYEHLFD